MTEAQIEHMVQRFLNWKLPTTFRPDGGVIFEPIANQGTPHERKREPVGTNLLDGQQAKEMVQHMIDGLPQVGPRDAEIARPRDVGEAVTPAITAMADTLRACAELITEQATEIARLRAALGELEAANDALAAAAPARLYNALTDGVPGIDALRVRLDSARRAARAALAPPR